MNAMKYCLSLLFALLFVGAAFAQTDNGAVKVDIKNEKAVNTDGLDFSPTFYEDGIVFISTNSAGLKKLKDDQLKLPATSILRAARGGNGDLQKPEPFAKELSSLYHEGPVCFDRTAETVYFSRNNLVNGKEKRAKDQKQKMGLYVAKKSGATWSTPEALPFLSSEYDDCHPSLSIDGDKLFFASNRPGGFGGMDLYVAYRVNESWSEPVNLGSEVNTKGNEVFPFVHADNTLYFASTGLGGEGGLDLFMSTPDDAKWKTPVNMGKSFNTKGDDFGLIVDLNKINGYFASNGMGGQGGDEIMGFHTEGGDLDDLLDNKPTPVEGVIAVKVMVTEKATKAKMPNATVSIVNLEGANVIGRDDQGNLIAIQSENGQDVMRTVTPDKGIVGTTDAEGKFSTEIKPGSYVVIVTKPGFQTKQLQLNLTKPDNTLDVVLEQAAGKVRWNASAFNHLSNTPMAGAAFVLTNRTTGQRDTVYADQDGMVDHYLDANTKYRVDMYQGGRQVGSTEIDTATWGRPGFENPAQNISVAPLSPGAIIELPNIYYNFNDATLRPDARKDLDLVIALMKQHPTLTVELSSHTDSRGSASYNAELSQRRANGVVEYLVTQGISRNRLRPVGYGEAEPRNRCRDGVTCNEQEYARNRRTSVRVLTGVQGATFIYMDGSNATTPETGVGNEPAPSPYTGTATTTKVYSGNGSMEYFVVAGSFMEEARAKRQLSTVSSAGYSEAYVTQFPNSQFYSVCVGKFNSRREAESLKRQISRSRIDAFVRPTRI
jgi:outer membrane protein OmpA-like peptidoglycan-associated protein